MEDMNNKKKSLSATDAFRKILRDKKVVSAYLEKNGSLRGFDDTEEIMILMIKQGIQYFLYFKISSQKMLA